MGVFVYHGHVAVAKAVGHAVHGEDAIEQRGAGADRHQRIHVRRAVGEGLEADDVELAVDEDDRHGDDQLRQRRDEGVFRAGEESGHRQAHHAAHGHVHQRDEQDNRRNEAALHRRLIVLGALLARLPLLAEAGRGLRLRALRRGLGVAGAVADLLHRRADDGGGERAFIVFDRHAAGEQVDVHILDAFQLLHAAGDVGLAGRARHAGDVEFLRFHGLPPI